VADSHSNSQLSFDQSPLAAVFVVAVFVAVDSRSNRQPSFDQSPVAIRHSLPFLSWLFLSRLIAAPTGNLRLTSRPSLFAIR
jgi:hypothetical protein